jgi:hypothetical protein
MEDVVSRFFLNLNGFRQVIPGTISGTIRFDLLEGKRAEHWLTTFDKGTVSTVESNEEADCVVRSDRATFGAIIEGRMNMMAALLRGAINVEGRSLLLGVFRKLLATPITTPGDVESAGYARRMT